MIWSISLVTLNTSNRGQGKIPALIDKIPAPIGKILAPIDKILAPVGKI
jgi:hypothetical protein